MNRRDAREALHEAAAMVLQDAALIYAIPLSGSHRWNGPVLRAELMVHRPWQGRVSLAAAPSMGILLASSMDGLDLEPTSVQSGEQALSEILNTLARVFVEWWSQRCCPHTLGAAEIGAPVVEEISSGDHEQRFERSLVRSSLVDDQGNRIDATVDLADEREL